MNRQKSDLLYLFFLFIAYIICLSYITFFSRIPTLIREVDYDPFRAYRLWFAGSNIRGMAIFQNIALFVPCGYLISSFLPRKRTSICFTILIGIGLSLLIEVLQFYTGRGTADTGDLLNNAIGTWVGHFLYYVFNWIEERYNRRFIRLLVEILLSLAMIFGCIQMHRIIGDPTPEVSQFDFSIDTIDSTDEIIFTGHCKTYFFSTPEYQIFLRGNDGTIAADTDIRGNNYIASADTSADGNYEVFIRFRGFPQVSTATFIKNSKVAYVDEDIVEPKNDLLVGAVLKAYSSVYDTFVFEQNKSLLWLIGYDIDDSTEIILHIDTNEKEKLPENCKQYGFDNIGFKATSNEIEPIGHYRVFRKNLPDIYNITGITVGLNAGGNVKWSYKFRTEKKYDD